MSSSSAGVVTLPQWYARLSHVPDDGAPDDRSASMRVGPFTVHGTFAGGGAHEWAEGTRTALFHGDLFDRHELAAAVGCAADASPAQLVAAAYERWGTDCFLHLDGCYLAAVWDGRSGQAVIGHDGLGRHPVFYVETPRGLWFSANVLSLAASRVVPPQPNRISLALLGVRYWPEAGETYFEAIRRLRPGHVLVVTPAGTVREQKVWELLPADDEPWLPEAQVLEEFEPALARAVARCMQLSPQGIMLSGGVDSVTIAALAAEFGRAHRLSPLAAVSGRSGGPLSYEEVMQERVAAALGMPLHLSTTAEWREGRDPIQLSLDLAPDLPSPGTVYWVGTYTGFYRRAARDGLQVLLTGAGGDNWLSVGDAHAADLLAHGRLRALMRFLRSDLTTGGRSVGSVMSRRLWAFGLRPHLDAWWGLVAPAAKRRFHRRRWEASLPAWLAPDRALRAALVDRLLARRTPSLAAGGRPPRSHYRHALRSYANPYMHHENETAFHVDAMCGVRLLSPYHDRRLVMFFHRISPDTLVYGTRYKGLLRPIVARHLPGLGLEAQRKVYEPSDMARETEDVRHSVGRALADHSFGILDGLGVVDREALSAERATIGGAGLARLGILYGLMSAERWLQVRAAT